MLKERFFGRQEYLNILDKRVSALKFGYRQNLAIIGDELVGKTSMLCTFLNTFQDNQIILLYLETRNESVASFTKRFIGVLLYNFLNNSGLTLREDLDFLIKKSESYIPKTIEKIKALLKTTSKRKKNNVFTEILSLCEMIHEETGKFCVVILDEFHNLQDIAFVNLYREWSRLLITQKNTMYIIVSSKIYKTKAILSKDLSLLFGNFEVVTVEPFDIKESERFLEHRLCALSLNIGLRNFIVYFTGGCPLYLEVIAERLSAQSSQKDLVGILVDILFESPGILNQRFSNYIKRFQDTACSNDYISILHLIASGKNRIKDIAHLLKKQKKELSARISYLLEIDVINRSGDFLTINDRVLSFWLKFVHMEKLHSLTFDAKSQKEKLQHNLETMIAEFLTSTQKPIMERMKEILQLFENEMVHLETKKIRLNQFREVKQLEFNNSRLKEGLIGRSADSLWIMAYKNDFLNEDDIAEFARECKKYGNKLQRKIIITLKDIDENTQLRALEEKILTWDINNLNQILDLFNKPRVIA